MSNTVLFKFFFLQYYILFGVKLQFYLVLLYNTWYIYI